MKLNYPLPLEHRLKDMEIAMENEPILMVASSGIPALYALSKSKASITAVDIDQNQFLLLNLLSSAAVNLGIEGFMSFVLGRIDKLNRGNLDEIINEISNKLEFPSNEDVLEVINQYAASINKYGESSVLKWYDWLNPQNYRELRESLNEGRLITKFGEFTNILIFESDGYYGFIDLSNIREWKYQASEENQNFNIERNYELYLTSFEEWDRRLSQLCIAKTKDKSLIWVKSFPDFWGKNQPAIEECDYWSGNFALKEKTEYSVLHNQKEERVLSSFHVKKNNLYS